MLRFVLISILLTAGARAFWRIVEGIVQGMNAPSAQSRAPQRGVPMERDPVCGTFVLPDRAVKIADGRTHLFFCSEACRDKYRARSA